jgi:hypothetical protein
VGQCGSHTVDQECDSVVRLLFAYSRSGVGRSMAGILVASCSHPSHGSDVMAASYWWSCNDPNLYPGLPVRISGGAPTVLPVGFRGFLQFLGANSGIVPQLDYGRFLPSCFLFHIHQSYHLVIFFRSVDVTATLLSKLLS